MDFLWCITCLQFLKYGFNKRGTEIKQKKLGKTTSNSDITKETGTLRAWDITYEYAAEILYDIN